MYFKIHTQEGNTEEKTTDKVAIKTVKETNSICIGYFAPYEEIRL